MKSVWTRWAWPVGKALLAACILGAIGRKFYLDLRDLNRAQLTLRPGWLALSCGLYLGGLLTSAWYWYHLLHVFGQRPTRLILLRAYFMGHLGKYVPGKAWALLLRGTFVRGPETLFGVAIIASFYEVLTTMAAAGLVAVVIFAIEPPGDIPGLAGHPLLASLLMLALCTVPLLPGVFNRVVGRMARRFERVESFRLPQLRIGTLLLGLAVTAVGWLLLGLGVWALLQGMLSEPPAWSTAVWLRCTASISLAFVAGFLVVFVPGGLGAREYLLRFLLAFASPTPGVVDAAVLMLRLLWTAVEVCLAGLLWLACLAVGPAAAAPRLGDSAPDLVPLAPRDAAPL